MTLQKKSLKTLLVKKYIISLSQKSNQKLLVTSSMRITQLGLQQHQIISSVISTEYADLLAVVDAGGICLKRTSGHLDRVHGGARAHKNAGEELPDSAKKSKNLALQDTIRVTVSIWAYQNVKIEIRGRCRWH